MNKGKVFSTILLTAVSVVGVVATAYLAAKETPKALELIKHEEEEVKYEPLTTFEKVQVTIPAYKWAIAAGIATIATVIFANVSSLKEVAALSAACAGLGEGFRKYKDKVADIFGEEADFAIREGISHDEHPLAVDAFDENERLFCFNDGVEDRFFTSTMAKVIAAEYELNKRLSTKYIVSLSDFYKLIGLEDLNNSEQLGWTYDMLCNWYNNPWIDFENCLVESYDPDTPNYIDITPLTEPAAGYDSGKDEWEYYMTHKYLMKDGSY